MRDPALIFLALLGIGVLVGAALHLVLNWHRRNNHERNTDDR